MCISVECCRYLLAFVWWYLPVCIRISWLIIQTNIVNYVSRVVQQSIYQSTPCVWGLLSINVHPVTCLITEVYTDTYILLKVHILTQYVTINLKLLVEGMDDFRFHDAHTPLHLAKSGHLKYVIFNILKKVHNVHHLRWITGYLASCPEF